MKSVVVLSLSALLAAFAAPVFSADTPQTKPAPAAPEVKEGTWTGKVSEKGENWLRVKTSEGTSERFMPRWIGGNPPGGGLDKTMLEKIKQVKVGSEVTLKWVWEERKRVTELTVVSQPAGDKPK